MKDRQVRLEVTPADDEVTANGVSLGRGNQDIKIPLNDCVTVTVNKDDYVEYTKVFRNKAETDPEPPVEK